MPELPRLSVPTAAVAGYTLPFAVRRIFCVGLNYADHAHEMGNDPQREPPFFFTKPADAIVPSGQVLPYPVRTSSCHHEVELVVAMGGGGSDIPVEHAESLIFGHAVGLDLTRRDMQSEAKRAGRPWDMAKGFDRSAPLGIIKPGVPPSSGAIKLSINGALRQNGDLKNMIWKVPEIIATLSTFIALAPGDLIFTGTPSGVGPIHRGETVVGEIDGLAPIKMQFAD